MTGKEARDPEDPDRLADRILAAGYQKHPVSHIAEMPRCRNGARQASNGVWVWRSGGYYGFGRDPEEALCAAERNYVGLPAEHAALIEYIKAGYADHG